MVLLQRRWLLALIGGALGGLGHAPFGWTEVAFAGLALALLMMRLAPGFRTAWAAGLGYFAVTLTWIIQPFLVDAAATGWMAPFALVFLAAGLAVFWGGAGMIARQLPGPVGLAAALLTVEILRSYLFTGFPWGLIGHLWLPLNTVQLDSLVGPFGLTLLVLLPLTLLTAADRTTRISGGAVLALLYLCNFWLVPPNLPKSTGPLVRIVQPNFDQSEKWNPDLANAQFTELGELSVKEPLADVTIWPESAFPWLYVENDPLWQIIGNRLAGPLITGTVRVDGKLGWNSVALIGTDGSQQSIYDKHHLVPFGEYIPFPWLLERIGLRRMTVGEGYGYVEGPGPSVVDIPRLGPTLMLICYEAVFPQDLVTPGKRPQVIVHLTNDAWFGKFSGPYQHLDQVRLRAIELGLPVLRAANTGVSAVIDPYGRVLDHLPLGTKGTLDYPLPQSLPPTVYARWGDLPMMFLTFCLLIITAFTKRKRLTL